MSERNVRILKSTIGSPCPKTPTIQWQEALSDPVRIVVGTVGQANEDIRQEVLVLKASQIGLNTVVACVCRVRWWWW